MKSQNRTLSHLAALGLLVLALTACAPKAQADDPIAKAQADAITRDSIQRAADAEVTRTQALLDQAQERTERAERAAAWSMALPVVIVLMTVTGCALVVIGALVGLYFLKQKSQAQPQPRVILLTTPRGRALLVDPQALPAGLLDARLAADLVPYLQEVTNASK